MKKLVIILSFVIFLKPLLPLAEYIIHYDYISKVLCENKNKPKLQCNGKCHLMKELGKAADSGSLESKSVPQEKKAPLHEIELLFFQEIHALIITFSVLQSDQTIASNYSNLYFHLSTRVVFHPPAFLA